MIDMFSEGIPRGNLDLKKGGSINQGPVETLPNLTPQLPGIKISEGSRGATPEDSPWFEGLDQNQTGEDLVPLIDQQPKTPPVLQEKKYPTPQTKVRVSVRQLTRP